MFWLWKLQQVVYKYNMYYYCNSYIILYYIQFKLIFIILYYIDGYKYYNNLIYIFELWSSIYLVLYIMQYCTGHFV